MAYTNPYMNSGNYPAAGYTGQAFPQPAQQQPVGLNWVQGEGAAKASYVAPGCTVPFFDSDDQIIYIKSVDANGMPTMEILDYTIREKKTNVPYVTKNDLDTFKQEILDALKAREAVNE